MGFCIGIFVISIITFGGVLIYSFVITGIANRERIRWTKTLYNLELPELELILDDLEKQKKALQKERLLTSGYKRKNLDVIIGELFQRIKIVKSFLEN